MFDKIKDSIQKFSSKGVADEEAVNQLVKDIQRDLIKADVDVTLVQELSDEIKEEALKEDLPSGLTRKEHVVEIVYNKLENLLGEEAEIQIEPHTVLLAGLYGAGKTTTAGKLADYYRKRGLKTGLIAADTDRPAAHEQLKQLAEDADTEFYGEKNNDDPVEIIENGKEKLDADMIIVDSAGRNSLDQELTTQLQKMSQAIQPDEKYLVIPADIGQSAKTQAQQFDEAIDITGVIVTKMDSSAKGGGAITACKQANAQVKFIGDGETLTDIKKFRPVDYVSQMIGQPDLESLLEKVEQLDTDPEEMLEGDFTLEDFQQQISQVTDAGMMEEVMQQLPFGSSKMPDNLANMTEKQVSNYNYIIDSMTKEEKQDPSMINKNRVERIAKGSGTTTEQVRNLVKHYRQTKNMMDKFDKKDMKRGNMQNMMNKMGF